MQPRSKTVHLVAQNAGHDRHPQHWQEVGAVEIPDHRLRAQRCDVRLLQCQAPQCQGQSRNAWISVKSANGDPCESDTFVVLMDPLDAGGDTSALAVTVRCVHSRCSLTQPLTCHRDSIHHQRHEAAQILAHLQVADDADRTNQGHQVADDRGLQVVGSSMLGNVTAASGRAAPCCPHLAGVVKARIV